MSTSVYVVVARKRAEWLNPVDERILETLEVEGNLTPGALDEVYNVASASHASDRLSLLTEYGLTERIHRGLYRLTEDGQAFLDGDLDTRDLEPTDSQ